jgi:hypothetical protein
MDMSKDGPAWLLTGNAGTNPATNFLGTTDAQPLVIRTNNTEQMRVTETGNVGIGTTAPGAKLHVHGGTGTFINVSGAMPAGDGNQGLIGYGLANSSAGYYWTMYLADPDGGFGASPNSFEIWEYPANLGSGVCCRARLRIRSSDGLATPAEVVIDPVGNVGIGTTSPGYRLTLAGSGTIFAVDNASSFASRNASGTYEIYLWPRWSDNIMYLNYGSNGFNIRNNSSVSTMFMTNNNNVGIGTTGPIHRLDVRGGPTYTTRSWTGNVSLNNGGAIAWDKASPTDYTFGIGKTSTPPGFYFWSSTSDLGSNTNPPTYLMQIDYITGNVGIGTILPPAYRLHVVGNVYANNFITPSDQRWKTNIKPIQNALDNVLKMQGVTYYWKVDEYPDKHFPEGEQVGFIAQEIEKVYPQVVLTDKEGHKSVDYSKLTPVLVEAIKEQQKIIEELQKVIQQLQEENSQIKQANAQLSAEIKMLNEKVDNLINSLSNDKKLGYR